MNTNQLKRFAKDARIKLIDLVGRKLEFVVNNSSQSFIDTYAAQIQSLKDKIQQTSREQVIEIVAYTWFNRLMALRFMDANGYTLPKVITPLPGMTNPEILQNALAGHIEAELHLDRQRLNNLLDGRTAAADAHTEAYKMLLVAVCNQWHKAMPFMFERISDYTELLLPDDLLSDYSIVADIRNGMSDEDCQQEEVIGWLYQFYISDKKDDVFEGLKKNIKISAENIPAATQLFTPRWIVRYMVENTLGKLWLSFKPTSKLRGHMPYFIEAPEGNSPAPLPEGIKGVTDITFLDPCQGSGHVLVYAFDLFTKIYEEEGYNTNEIPALILQHNLFGIDIDPRAAQLAAFALTMKARCYYSRFLRKPVQPNVIALENISEETIQQSVKLPITINGKKIEKHSDLSLSLLKQADNLGSLIQIDPVEVNAIQLNDGNFWQIQQKALKLQAEFLSQKYHCVVTNPPYMGGKGMNDSLKQILLAQYPQGKSDLFAAFILRCQNLIVPNGFTGMVTMESWMFLSSYEELRRLLIDNTTIHSLSHFGWHIMRIAFGTCSFIFQKSYPAENNKGVYSHLEIEDMDKEMEIPYLFPKKDNGRFNIINQKDFEKIPGIPIGYWVSKKMIEVFNGDTIKDFGISDGQNITGENSKYLRYFWEISKCKNGKDLKWVPIAKGGSFRRWYGNIIDVIDWSIKARTEYKENPIGRLQDEYLWFREGITWNLISSNGTGFRYLPATCLFNKAAPTIIINEDCLDKTNYLLGFLNTKVVVSILKILNPTFNTNIAEVFSLPIQIEMEKEVSTIVNKNISISKNDWDSRESAYDFQQNELIKQQTNSIKIAFENYKKEWSDKFYELHRNEEELNRQFIEIYGLQDELTPDVPLEEITILQEEGKIVDGQLEIQTAPVMLQLISYAVGCMFGRYSLDKPGLILANQGDTVEDYNRIVYGSYLPPLGEMKGAVDSDNIIPVLDGEWFTDDIVGRFSEFLKAAFGAEYFEDNLKYIKDNIPAKDIRKYFVKDFYNDHIKRYKKRPIYWMFSSPKGHFKALIYMHRYQPDLCSRMLNEYLQPFIAKLDAAKNTQTMFTLREDISGREKTLASKEIERLEDMLKDCRKYETTLFALATQKITIDLDDGVKVNYQKFKDVLVPIKGLEKEEE
jgi:type II restriction/modification system DNA methylase subunit YeeA